MEIIKRNGSREPFDGSKLKNSIQRAAESVGINQERIDDLYNKVKKDLIFYFRDVSEVSSLEVKSRTLEFLDMEEPSISDIWRSFDDKHNSLNNT